jgi:hypothetical protein
MAMTPRAVFLLAVLTSTLTPPANPKNEFVDNPNPRGTTRSTPDLGSSYGVVLAR